MDCITTRGDPMSTFAETINMRADAERKRRLQLAVDLSHQSSAAFVLNAADEFAERVIVESRSTTLPANFFDDSCDTLAPEPSPTLSAAAS